MELNSKLLADHFADAYHRGECDNANYASEGTNDETGCAIRIELVIADDSIQEAWFESEGCPVCESIASVTMEAVEGKPIDEAVKTTIESLLSAAGPSEIDDANSSKCAQLPLDVLRHAIATPIDALDDDLADGTTFGGPSLREEC